MLYNKAIIILGISYLLWLINNKEEFLFGFPFQRIMHWALLLPRNEFGMICFLKLDESLLLSNATDNLEKIVH